MLFLAEWKLATELVVFGGKLVVNADDSDHAIDRTRDFLGKEGQVANISISEVGSTVYEMSRTEKIGNAEYSAAMPRLGGSGDLFVFELAARANVVASSEKMAWARFAKCARSGKSDGKYCKLFRGAVLEKEPMTQMSAYEKHLLNTQFQRVQGGAVSPR